MSLYVCREGCTGSFFLNWPDYVLHLEESHNLDWEPADPDQYGTT